MNIRKFKHLRSKVMFTIVGGAVIINPVFAHNATSPESAQPLKTMTAKPLKKNGRRSSRKHQNSSQSSSQSNTQNNSQSNSPTSAKQLSAVVVTGIRHSLAQSMNIKRDAIGFVDAISAEAIGKFPDSNLAVSLQRVPGVSISRRNGTGALVTVRGFGPQYNLVTFNGRHIPGADGFGNGQISIGGIGTGTRSFNFAELSPIGVRALVVHKTGRADVDGGGIGATIDIETWRPLERKAGKVVASLTAKGIYDKGQPFNTSVTPQYSGIFSYASPDKTWGVSLVASHGERHTGNGQFTENSWVVKKWTGSDPGIAPGGTVVNAPKIGQLYAIPNDTRYSFYALNTKRTNAHAVFQLHPIDSLTLTLDYLYSKYDLSAERDENSEWLQDANSFTNITFDTQYPIATPTMVRDVPPVTKDFDDEQQAINQKFQLNSIGFNAKWDATENLVLSFDGHDSKNKSTPNGPYGDSMTDFSMAGTNNCYGPGGIGTGTGSQCGGAFAQTLRFNGTFPKASRSWFPSLADAMNNVGGVENKPWGPQNVGVANDRIWSQSQTSEIKEGKIDGTYFLEDGRLQFGVDWQDSKLHHINHAVRTEPLGGWSIANANQFADLANFYHIADESSVLSHFDTSGTDVPNGIAANGGAYGLDAWAEKHYPGFTTDPDPTLADDQHVDEKTKAVYFQLTHNDTLAGFPTTMRIGLRYETTKVDSNAVVAIPSEIVWESNNDFTIDYSNKTTNLDQHATYDNLLPNFDFSILFPHNIKARMSVGRTMARANYGNLYVGPSPGTPSGSILVNPADQGLGSQENPALKPLVSNNLDIGAGWYFAPTSYVSATFWDKRVKNFIGTEQVTRSVLGLTDPTSGPRAQAAAAFLASSACATQVTAAGQSPATQCALNNTNLFTAVALESTPGSGGLSAYNGTGTQETAEERNVDVVGNPDDPLYQFKVSQPVNEHEAQLHGWELSGQYFLGQTGFGFLANYTIVKSDTHFDNNAAPGTTQFALTGLSNTANAALMYQKYGWSVRLAYNWRGKYLMAVNQEASSNPYYVDAYHEYDLSVDYQFTKHLSAKFIGINLTSQPLRWVERTPDEPVRIVDQKPRYALAVTYTF